MTRRKSRLGDEDRAHKAPASGSAVFPPSKDRAGCGRIEGVVSVDGESIGLYVRWPASTARRGPVDPPVEREIIDLEGRQKVTVTYEDPYLRAEELAAQRKGVA